MKPCAGVPHEVLGRRPQGPIRLLTHLRTFGHCFNPVSFYYCYQADGTSWTASSPRSPTRHGRNATAMCWTRAAARREGQALCWDFPKAFHVSPFLPMRRDYAWRFTTPAPNCTCTWT